MKKNRKLRLRRIAARSAARRQEREGVTLEGKISMTPGGYGFFTPDEFTDDATDEIKDIFIPAKFAGSAIDGDRVKIKLLPPRKDHPEDLEKGPVGKVLEILERSRESFIAELLPGSFVSPLNNRLPEVVSIYGSRKGAIRGNWVKIECETGRHGELTGRIAEVLGKVGDIAGDLDAIMAEFDLPGKYSDAEEAEAATIIPAEIPRTDCRDLFVLTIDPFDAKDFDDALSVEENGDGTITLGIHIADVAAYIQPKSFWDKAAARRSFSCYLPGRTLPMLPAGLTAKISMQQDQISLAHSVFLTISQDGKVLDGKRKHTVIKVAQRLNYDEVQNFLDTQIPQERWLKKTVPALTLLTDTVRKMRKFRENTEKFIELPLPEIRVVCDEKNNAVIGVEKRFSRESEQLVEECMLAANQFVGKELPQKSIAGIYRIHPEPEMEKTIEFSETMKEAFGLPVGDITDRKCCREFIASLPDDEIKPLILGMILRSMARASYSTRGELHFALGKTFYAHFTSPIRRYTDLTVHQQLWNFDLNNRLRNAAALEKIAAYASETEENIDAASSAANERLKIRIINEELEKTPGKKFDCLITRIMNYGIQVDVSQYAITAYVDMDDLKQPLSTLKIGMNITLRGNCLRFSSQR